MNLKAITLLVGKFKKYLGKGGGTDTLFIYEAQHHFQENWDMDTSDFVAMYDASLQCSTTKRLWIGDNYFPKEMIMKFGKLQGDFVPFLFKDLFYETNNIVGRMDRFIFHCDELLREYKDAHPASVENNHFHDDDYWMTSLYLAFRYPDQYTLYSASAFRDFLKYP